MDSPVFYDQPHIKITIPKELSKDFLGIMILDILHDSKGYGHLAGSKLSQVTDLVSQSILYNNIGISEEKYTLIKDYVFLSTVDYFIELWDSNMKALNLGSPTRVLKDTFVDQVLLPIRNVAGRIDEDTFISLGPGQLGVEAQNYINQRNKLPTEQAQYLNFVSPKDVTTAQEYFQHAINIVNTVQTHTEFNSRVVLDMKSAAGLLRTVTDPLGYITGMPTYADPGYNMPGMSAIRKHADVLFVQEPQQGVYGGPKEFQYSIQLEIPGLDIPIIFMQAHYFYGNSTDGLDRNNIMVHILGDPFQNMLPRSVAMADSLGAYLKHSPCQLAKPTKDVFQMIKDFIWYYYEDYCESIMLPAISDELQEWCDLENTPIRASYLGATLRNMEYYDINFKFDHWFLPEIMISQGLTGLLYGYILDNDKLHYLAFCYHQLLLLEEYINYTDCKILRTLLQQQWLPARKGKLTTQVNKLYNKWCKEQAELLTSFKGDISQYLCELSQFSTENLHTILDIDRTEEYYKITNLLPKIPAFSPTDSFRIVLDKQLYFYFPEMYSRVSNIPKDGILLAILIEYILRSKLELSVDLDKPLTTVVQWGMEEYSVEYLQYSALRKILGKFSGDFGQIVWSICYNQLFASEDNNASAMALLLHRLPEDCISRRSPAAGKWGNIHGLGDGGSVDITLHKVSQ